MSNWECLFKLNNMNKKLILYIENWENAIATQCNLYHIGKSKYPFIIRIKSKTQWIPARTAFK
jgi:hypothetical protein